MLPLHGIQESACAFRRFQRDCERRGRPWKPLTAGGDAARPLRRSFLVPTVDAERVILAKWAAYHAAAFGFALRGQTTPTLVVVVLFVLPEKVAEIFETPRDMLIGDGDTDRSL